MPKELLNKAKNQLGAMKALMGGLGKRRDSLDAELGLGAEGAGSESAADEEEPSEVTTGPMSCNEDFFRALVGANERGPFDV